MNIKDFKNSVKEILKDNNIQESLIGKREKIIGAKEVSIEIMLMAGMDKKTALAAMYGVQQSPKTQVSVYLTDVWNFCQMYDGFILQYCIDLATRFIEGNQNCEVGLKYPHFEPLFLKQRYSLTLTGVYEPHWSKSYKDKKKSERTYYELWQNEDKTVSFSFEKDRMGKGGYAGATFDTFERAINFIEWFFQNPQHDVKDCDLFVNKLGGLSLKEITEINNIELIPA